MNNISTDVAQKTIAYHPGVVNNFWIWTEAARCSPDELKALTESSIRTCHQAALIEELPHEQVPLVYALGLGQIRVYYSIENEIVIRGYSENIPRHYLDEESAGGFYSNGSW